jgi:hypothetical protein
MRKRRETHENKTEREKSSAPREGGADPASSLHSWIPAVMVEVVYPGIVSIFEDKERDRVERKRAKAKSSVRARGPKTVQSELRQDTMTIPEKLMPTPVQFLQKDLPENDKGSSAMSPDHSSLPQSNRRRRRSVLSASNHTEPSGPLEKSPRIFQH